MNGQILKNRWKDRNIIVISGLIIIFSIVIIILFFSANFSGKIVYITTNGSGDFNCNGSDDQIEINKALAFVTENPQYTTVYLRGPNTYIISNSIFIGSNTVLEGDSSAVVKLKDKADWNVDKPLITQMDGLGDHDITIKGFEINGNHDNNSDRRDGTGYYNLMYFVNSDNIQVHDMYMHDSHGDGLKISRGSNIQFYKNIVYKMGHDALYAIHCSNLEAWNNNITCRTNSGLRIYDTNHVIFANNIINSEGEGGAGIEVQKDDPQTIMDDIEICNNLLDETNAAGIWITGYGSEYSKDSAKDIHIHDNKFYKTGIDLSFDWVGGIVLNGFQNTLIDNNFFDGCYGAAIAHKQVTDEFSAPGSGYTTIVKNNIITNTQPDPVAGKGYAVYNKLKDTHSFILENNCLSNNIGGNYMYANSTSDVEVDSGFLEKVSKNNTMRENFPWNEALSAGPKRHYIPEEGIPQTGLTKFESSLKRALLNILGFLKRILNFI